ncbi:hypothetical protein GF396_01245 [Candidatus Pacearchaeota archaeon]|nr:hypothetical protein [Candidatus Pacearchaeota archaeon]
MTKTVLLELDEAYFDIIKPLVKMGKLPVFKKLIEKGVSRDLDSTIPTDIFQNYCSRFCQYNVKRAIRNLCKMLCYTLSFLQSYFKLKFK